MAINLTAPGIQSITTSLVESLSVEKSLDESPVVLTSVGGFSAAEAYNPTFTFTVKGKGDIDTIWNKLGDAPGVGGDIDGITGGITLIGSVKEMEHNEAHNEWEAGGKNFPGAS